MTDELDSPSVLAAIRNEGRLTAIEGKLDNLITVQKQLVDRVTIQNGRVSTHETSIREIRQAMRDREELIEQPRWGRFESVASQVRTLWEDRATNSARADGRDGVLKLQWRIVQDVGRIAFSGAALGAVVFVLKAVGIL